MTARKPSRPTTGDPVEGTGLNGIRRYSDNFWASAEEYPERERDRAGVIVAMVPEGIRSVLEVGCGDGLIINRIEVLETMGLDLSSKGLESVRGPTTLGSVSDMPFRDKSWDLVIASEVLEHVLEDEYESAIEEITRVASKNIVISVPNRQDLERGMTVCPRCGCIFHANYHFRSFVPEDLEALFSGFRLREWFEGGDLVRVQGSLEKFVRHRILNRWAPFGKSKCLHCGYSANSDQNEAVLAADPVAGRSLSRGIVERMPVLSRTRKRWLFASYERCSS